MKYALRVADKESVDWDIDSPEFLDIEAKLNQLRIVDYLAKAFESEMASYDVNKHDSTLGLVSVENDEVLFKWGHLRVLERIGVGSYGEVYRAFDTMLEREVALKLRRPSVRADAIKNTAFIEEARRLARVRQANVLAIHGADMFDGRVGMWSDLLSGETLADHLCTNEQLHPDEIKTIALSLGKALTAVHAAGLVHGDIKASNVMVQPDGRIILMDFGAGAKTGSDEDPNMSSPLYGTPLLMAPELFFGSRLTPPCDMYSLGALLFKLISGRTK